MKIQKATKTAHIQNIEKLAYTIWNDHYVPIIGQNQVDYMLKKFQSSKAISSQIKKGYDYFLISDTNKAIGYLCLVYDNSEKKLMISKIYIASDKRGFGYGKKLIDFTIHQAKEKKMKSIWLTVNKNNTNSIKWYQKLNFKITDQVVMDIGNNFVMDDYVMELQLN
jgi:diamine N-acetyltransferase